MPGPPKFFTSRQLGYLSVMTVLSVAGMISAVDIAFVPFSILYAYFLSKVAFPPVSTGPSNFGGKNTAQDRYVLLTAVVGLFLPIAYMLGGIIEGDQEAIRAAAPHLFLLSSQVFMEWSAFWAGFSLPVFIFVPVFYNSRRIFTILDWLRSEFSTGDELGMGGSTVRRLHVGRALAVANMALWCFNLFGLLLPVFLPKAFKIYYSKIKD